MVQLKNAPLCAVYIRGPGGYFSWDFAVKWSNNKFGSFEHGNIGYGTPYTVLLCVVLPEVDKFKLGKEPHYDNGH